MSFVKTTLIKYHLNMKRFYLEITNSCNLNCPFCSYDKGLDFMPLENIDCYLDQIKEYCNFVYLHILGEPLLHPDFKKILDLLDEKKMQLQLVTNGVLLDKHPDIFSHACLRKLSISLHSINNLNIRESYYETIDKLIAAEKKAVLELRFYDEENLDADLKTYLQKLKDRYGLAATKRLNSYQLKEKVYVSFAELFEWPDINQEIISETGTCHGGLDMLAINVHSEVTLCCLDPKAYNSLGNLQELSLKQIIESEEYKKICKDLMNHKIEKELCKRCSYRLRFLS